MALTPWGRTLRRCAVGFEVVDVRLTLPEKPRSGKPRPRVAALGAGSKDDARREGKLEGEAAVTIPVLAFLVPP